MQGNSYRFKTPTLGISSKDGYREPVATPAGAIARVVNGPMDNICFVDLPERGGSYILHHRAEDAMQKPPSIETESMMIPVLAVTPNNEDDAALDLMLPRPKWALEKAHSLAAAIAKLQKRNAIRLILCESELAPDSWRQMLEYLKHMDEPPLLIVTSRQADEQLGRRPSTLAPTTCWPNPLIQARSPGFSAWRGCTGVISMFR